MADGAIRERTRIGGISQDYFMGVNGSFQYSENIDCFSDMRGIKLANKAQSINKGKYLLISLGENAMRIPVQGGDVTIFNKSNRGSGEDVVVNIGDNINCYDAIVFQDFVRVIFGNGVLTGLLKIPIIGGGTIDDFLIRPVDPNMFPNGMEGYCNSITNLNNKVLLVGNGQYFRCYNPAFDPDKTKGQAGRKVIKAFENGTNIVGISPGWEYVKVYMTNEGWHSSIQYFQASAIMEDSLLLNCIELENIKISRVYPYSTTDYFITNLDLSENNVSLNKMVGYDNIPLLKEKKGLQTLDIDNKIGYFIGPTSREIGWYEGKFYVADTKGVFEFSPGNPIEYGTMKRRLNPQGQEEIPYGLMVNQDYLYVSYEDKEYRVKLYNSGIDGYQESGFLISRVIETDVGGEFIKTLKEVIVQYELNPLTSGNGKIELFISKNRSWTGVGSDPTQNGRVKVMEIDQNDAGKMRKRVDPSGSFAYATDFNTIEYLVKITVGSENKATPVLRSVLIEYDNVLNE